MLCLSLLCDAVCGVIDVCHVQVLAVMTREVCSWEVIIFYQLSF